MDLKAAGRPKFDGLKGFGHAGKLQQRQQL